MREPHRCEWCLTSPLDIKYHDEEWGVPVYNDQILFEFLTLEGAQAGLSWATILKKRETYRVAFDNFDPNFIANYDQSKIDELLTNPGIVRNKLKVKSTVSNARIFLDIQKEYGSFSKYIWQFVDHKPIKTHPKTIAEVRVTSPESDIMSKTMKKKGFKFIGSTICYAYMQAVGMVDDHIIGCHRY